MYSFVIEVVVMFDYVPHIFAYVCGYTTQFDKILENI